MALNHKTMVAGVKLLEEKKGGLQAGQWVQEAFERGDLKPSDIDIGRLFAECFGYEQFQACRGKEMLTSQVFEASGPVSTAAFTHLTNQFIVTAIREAYMSEDFVFSKIIQDEQSDYIGMEKVGDITPIGDQALVVPEGTRFPQVAVGEDWIYRPEAVKRGAEVALTREAVFMGKQLPLEERCANLGYSIGLSKEKRVIDCVIDENAGAVNTPYGHRYNWRGTYLAGGTYNDNTSTHTFDNLVGTNALVDWTDADNAEQALNEMVDPSTREPIVLGFPHMVVTKQREKTALRIKNATEINVVTPGYNTTGNPTETKVGNPYQGSFEVVCSRLLAARMATDTTWYFGDLKRAFRYKVIFPQQTISMPPNSYDEFHYDVIRQWRSDEHGAAWTKEPRAMTKNTES